MSNSENSLLFRIDYGHIIEKDKNIPSRPQSSGGKRIIYKQENLEEMYKRLLGKAIEEYNAKQSRPDRKKKLAKVMLSPKSFREVTIRIKSENTVAADFSEIAKSAFDDYARSFEERNPCLKIFYAEMLVDEAPLLRIDFIPICHGHSRGLSTAVSFKGALKEQGCYPVNKSLTEQIMWAYKERSHIESLINQRRKKNKVERG